MEEAMDKLELLAPAGSREALEAAVNSGADAVYLGGKDFGARAFAGNFGDEEMESAVRFAHLHGVRVYVTVNTLVSDAEMRSAARWLTFLNDIGVDALIVQDFGILRVMRAVVPTLPAHASTQMTITSSAGVRFAVQNGIKRVVPARELSLPALKAACGEGAEIEAFAHGALCVCYSGQCLMSSMIGGRSGNRGQCAQPCRMRYTLEDASGKNATRNAGHYLLSPKDLNTLRVLPMLIKAGVRSFKIEGRMKRPEYVAIVTGVYRRAIDAYLRGKYEVPEDDLYALEAIFSRGFTTAYLERRQGRRMMSDERPNNHGVPVGKVVKSDKRRAVVRFDRDAALGDTFEAARGGERAAFTPKSMVLGGKAVTSVPASSSAEIDVPFALPTGSAVFRVFDSRLAESAKSFWGEKNKRHVPVSAYVSAKIGHPVEVTFVDAEGISAFGSSDTPVQAAKGRPTDADELRQRLDRLGTSEYRLEDFSPLMDDGAMVPASAVNEARRRAVEALDAARSEAFAPARTRVESLAADVFLKACEDAARQSALQMCKKPLLSVWADTPEKAKAALKNGADWLIFGGDGFSDKAEPFDDISTLAALAHSMGRKFAVSTPRIIAEAQEGYVRRLADCARRAGADQLNIHSLSAWQVAAEANTGVPLWADMSLNVFNSQAVFFWAERSAVGISPSIELTLAQIGAMRKLSPLPFECLVHGAVEMMVSEYCAAGSFIGGLDKGRCSFGCREDVFLRDRTGARFRAAGDRFCRMHILNSRDLCMSGSVRKLAAAGIDRLRIDARSYDADTCGRLTALYRSALDGKECGDLPDTTRGHYFKGV